MNPVYEFTRYDSIEELIHSMNVHSFAEEHETVAQLSARAQIVRQMVQDARPFGADAVLAAQRVAENHVARLRRLIRAELKRKLGGQL